MTDPLPLAEQSDPYAVVSAATGGISINLIYDAAALAAPASFRAGIQQAANILATTIGDKITVNLKIDYSGTGGGAAAGPDRGLFEPYSLVRSDLINNATPGDTTFNALPNRSTIQGQSNVAVWNAELKLFGLLSANDTTTDDGSATFATDINPSLLVGVALHELTHALGRVPHGPQPDIFDLFRFTSPGTLLFQGGASAPAAYFSVDGGNAKLADYGRTSDSSDFLNSGVQGPNDPFNEFYGSNTNQQLSAVDLKQLDALGYHIAASTPSPPGFPDLIASTVSLASASIMAGGSTTVSYHVENDGNAAAGASLSAIYLSTDSIITTSDTLLATVNDGPLPNGFYFPDSTSIALPNNLASGTYWIGVIADAAGQVTESNETNNASVAVAVTVTARPTNDFNGDGHSDFLWQNDNGLAAVWLMNGTTFLNMGAPLPSPGASWHAIAGADFDGDGKADILWQNDNGTPAVWLMNGTVVSIVGGALPNPGPSWHAVAAGDFNGDGKADILWQNSNGTPAVWLMNGTGLASAGPALPDPGLGWHVRAAADFNGDGHADILWQNDNGTAAVWLMNGTSVLSMGALLPNPGPSWHAVDAADFDGNGHADILFQNDNGTPAVWLMNGTALASAGGPLPNPGPSWHVLHAEDMNGDGLAAILFQNDNGAPAVWLMNGTNLLAEGPALPNSDPAWHVVAHHDFLV